MARRRTQSDDERRERLKAKLEETLAESKRLRSNVSGVIESYGGRTAVSHDSTKRAA